MVCLARQQFIARLRLYSVIRRLIVGYEVVIARRTGQDRTRQYNTRQDKFELYESCKPLGLQQKLTSQNFDPQKMSAFRNFCLARFSLLIPFLEFAWSLSKTKMDVEIES